MARAIPPTDERADDDHYVVGQESEAEGPPLAARALRVLHGLLLAVLATISLAIFWLIGIMLGVL